MTFTLSIAGFARSILELEAYSFTSVFYPLKVIVTNAVFISILVYRRGRVAVG